MAARGAPSIKTGAIARNVLVLQVVLFLFAVASFIMFYKSFAVASFAVVGCVDAAAMKRADSSSSSVPQYFQTVPMLFPGQSINVEFII